MSEEQWLMLSTTTMMTADLVNIKGKVVVEQIVQGKTLDKGGLTFRTYGRIERKT